MADLERREKKGRGWKNLKWMRNWRDESQRREMIGKVWSFMESF
jgi:hypothetical protein